MLAYIFLLVIQDMLAILTVKAMLVMQDNLMKLAALAMLA
jgi:hypothetical protein